MSILAFVLILLLVWAWPRRNELPLSLFAGLLVLAGVIGVTALKRTLFPPPFAVNAAPARDAAAELARLVKAGNHADQVLILLHPAVANFTTGMNQRKSLAKHLSNTKWATINTREHMATEGDDPMVNPHVFEAIQAQAKEHSPSAIVCFVNVLDFLSSEQLVRLPPLYCQEAHIRPEWRDWVQQGKLGGIVARKPRRAGYGFYVAGPER